MPGDEVFEMLCSPGLLSPRPVLHVPRIPPLEHQIPQAIKKGFIRHNYIHVGRFGQRLPRMRRIETITETPTADDRYGGGWDLQFPTKVLLEEVIIFGTFPKHERNAFKEVLPNEADQIGLTARLSHQVIKSDVHSVSVMGVAITSS